MMRRRSVIGGAAALASIAILGPARAQTAQDFAGKTLRFVVPFPAGGVGDLTARLLLSNLSSRLGTQSVVIENKPGASGNIGTEYVANLRPDGLTYLAGCPVSQLTVNPYVPELRIKSVDVTARLQAVSPLADTPMILVVHASSPITTIEQFLAAARTRSIRIGNASTGTPQHLVALIVERVNGLQFIHVPYRGGAPMITDLSGGHLDAGVSAVPTAEPSIKSGHLRAIASIRSSSSEPYRGLPSLMPWMKNAQVPCWSGIFAPTGTPPEMVAALNAAVTAEVRTPAVALKLQELGMEPMPMTIAETHNRVLTEAAFMRDFLKDTKFDFKS